MCFLAWSLWVTVAGDWRDTKQSQGCIQVPQAHGQPAYPVESYLEMYAVKKKKKDEPEQSKFGTHSNPEIYRRPKWTSVPSVLALHTYTQGAGCVFEKRIRLCLLALL